MIRTITRLLTLGVLLVSKIEAFFFGFEQIFGNASVQDYKFYWNVPTFMCHQYGMHFEEVSRDFGILQNQHDEFRGNEIALLYDPGMFPALLKSSNGSLAIRNGGVPQNGDLTKHLKVFTEHVAEQIRDYNFSGLAIIDFESWRPIFRQNWASLAPYRDLSLKIEANKHPKLSKKAQKSEAIKNFERSGRIFMEETLKTAIALRPQAKWGYYAYPYCYNLRTGQPPSECDPKVFADNDKLYWIFKTQGVLVPSVYLRMSLSDNEKMGLITGRVREALRISKKMRPRTEVLPYFWYTYQDQRDIFLSREDVVNALNEILRRGANGYVIWGSTNDLNSQEKCKNFRNYLNEILGPAVVESKEIGKQRLMYEHSEMNPAVDASTEYIEIISKENNHHLLSTLHENSKQRL